MIHNPLPHAPVTSTFKIQVKTHSIQNESRPQLCEDVNEFIRDKRGVKLSWQSTYNDYGWSKEHICFIEWEETEGEIHYPCPRY